jgi:hypothetical protein
VEVGAGRGARGVARGAQAVRSKRRIVPRVFFIDGCFEERL